MKNKIICICGNFAKDGECGKCEYMIIGGGLTGVCEQNEYKDCVNTDKCFCGKYKIGRPKEF